MHALARLVVVGLCLCDHAPGDTDVLKDNIVPARLVFCESVKFVHPVMVSPRMPVCSGTGMESSVHVGM